MGRRKVRSLAFDNPSVVESLAPLMNENVTQKPPGSDCRRNQLLETHVDHKNMNSAIHLKCFYGIPKVLKKMCSVVQYYILLTYLNQDDRPLGGNGTCIITNVNILFSGHLIIFKHALNTIPSQ